MGRSSAPPLGRFSRQVTALAIDLVVRTGHDGSGRWLSSQIGMSHNYVAKRLRYELPFTTTDLERIASALGMTVVEFVEAATGPESAHLDPLEQALAAERDGRASGLAITAHSYAHEAPGESDEGTGQGN